MVIGRLLSYWKATFQGRTVKLQEGNRKHHGPIHSSSKVTRPQGTFGNTGGTASSKSNPAGGPRKPQLREEWSFPHFFQTWNSILSYFLCHDSWWKNLMPSISREKENEQISSQLKSRSKDAWHNSSFWQSWQPRHGGRYWKGQLVTLWTALSNSFGLDP